MSAELSVLSAENERAKLESFRDLHVWQRAMQLANEVYDASTKFPKEEYQEIHSLVDEVSRMSMRLIQSLKR